jgi:hypothetical protein
MLRLAADFPDPLIGLTPVLQGGVHEPGQPLPHRRHDLLSSPAELDIQGIQDHPPHVVLMLIPGAVADPDRTRSLIPGQVVQGLLGQVAFPADAVHDLQLEPPVEVTAVPAWAACSPRKGKLPVGHGRCYGRLGRASSPAGVVRS